MKFKEYKNLDLSDDGTVQAKATENAISIERNHILSMATLTIEKPQESDTPVQPAPPADEIWYTSTDGNIVERYKTGVFGATIISNTYEDGKGIIKFNGDVTSIGKYAFSNCSALKEVYCKPTTPPTGGDYMFGCNAWGRKIYVPTASVNAYKAAEGWSDYADSIEPYEFTE